MSWLLVAFIPGLLMLATFGLERIESRLVRDAVSPTEVAEFLRQAEADDVNTLARDGMSRAMDHLQQRLHDRGSTIETFATSIDMPGLPTRAGGDHPSNPEFQTTRHANRV